MRLLVMIHGGGLVVQQAEAVDAGVVGDVDYFGDLFEVDIVVGFYEGDSFHADGENVDQALAQVAQGDDFVVDLDVGMAGSFAVAYLDDDGCLRGRDGVVGGVGLLWNLGVETFGFLLNYDQHENDEQHKQNVNQGRDVHLGRGRTTACRE